MLCQCVCKKVDEKNQETKQPVCLLQPRVNVIHLQPVVTAIITRPCSNPTTLRANAVNQVTAIGIGLETIMTVTIVYGNTFAEVPFSKNCNDQLMLYIDLTDQSVPGLSTAQLAFFSAI